jgi:SUKH-3 immunity protein
MPVLPESILPLFTKAGWFEGRNTGIKSNNQNPLVASIFAEFGGLNVGEVGTGRECATSDVCFFNDASETIDEADDYKHFQKQVGKLSLIADAQHNHMQVLVDENGQFYVFTIADGKLYFAGEDFNEAMERLLLGFQLLAIK